MISALIKESFEPTLLDADDRIHEWMRDARETIHGELRHRLTADVSKSNSDLLSWQARAARDIETEASARLESLRAKRYAALDAQLQAEAEQYYNESAAALRINSDAELDAFKHTLKIETEQRKDNAQKAAHSAVRASTRNHPRTSTSSPCVTRSRARKGTPSQTPTRDPSLTRDHSITPKASPAVMALPSQALTEPLPLASQALSEPLTDISIGPPSNSFEVAMMDVVADAPTVKHSIHNPANTPIEPTPSPAPATTAADPPSLVDQIAAMIDAKLVPVTKSLRALTDRIDDIEEQREYNADSTPMDINRPYSPSNLAPKWATLPQEPHSLETSDSMTDRIDKFAELDLRAEHHARMGTWIVFKTLTGLPPSATQPSDIEDPNAPFAEAFSRFITVHDEVADQAHNEPTERPSHYFQSDEFHARVLDAWNTWGSEAAHANNLAPIPPPQIDSIPSPRTTTGPLPPSAPEPSKATTNPPRPPSPNGWSMIKNGKVVSFAKIVASTPPRTSPAPFTDQTPTGTLSKQQLNTLTKAQLLSIIKDKYKATANTRANKGALVTFILSLQSRANPIDLTSSQLSAPQPSIHHPTPPAMPQTTFTTTTSPTSRPRARPANQAAQYITEFTIQASAESISTHQPKQKAEDIVRSLRTAMNQLHAGGPALVTLLSGRWSSQLNHNFVLVFAGHPTNDQVYRYCSVLTSPFGPGAKLVPQKGYTRLMLHGVPLIRRQDGTPESSLMLLQELKRNMVCSDLLIVNAPTWAIRNDGPTKSHASISFAFIDEDGLLTQQIIRHPPSLFGATTKAEKSKPLPLIHQCARCHALGHEVHHCKERRGTTICPLCGSNHRAKDHHTKCPKAPHHGSITCNCPPSCINCAKAGKSPQGHTALDHSCPLRKAYRTPTNRMGDSSDEVATTITRAATSFEAGTAPVNEPSLSQPSSSQGERGSPPPSGGIANVPSREGLGSRPSGSPAHIDADDIHMTPAPSNPFAMTMAEFITHTSVQPDHPSFHSIFLKHFGGGPTACTTSGPSDIPHV